MATLFDLLRRTYKTIDPRMVSIDLPSALSKGVEVIESSNIVSMVYEDKRQQEKGLDIAEDFPNLAPPFEHFWIECKAPTVFAGGSWPPLLPKRWGSLFHAIDFKQPGGIRPKDINPKFMTKEAYAARWLYIIIEFWEMDGEAVPVFEWFLPINENGDHPQKGTSTESGYARIHAIHVPGHETDEMHQHESVCATLLHPHLMTVSLLHCKNITRSTTVPPAPLNKKALKRHGMPLFSYSTLNLHPMREVLRKEGGLSEGNGIAKALHICRGHFRNYDEKPLFGRVKGTFFIPQHVRGDASMGVHDKEYRIN